jgi:hypothetical protein
LITFIIDFGSWGAGADDPQDQSLGHNGRPAENGQFCTTSQFENIDGHSLTQKKKKKFVDIKYMLIRNMSPNIYFNHSQTAT